MSKSIRARQRLFWNFYVEVGEENCDAELQRQPKKKTKPVESLTRSTSEYKGSTPYQFPISSLPILLPSPIFLSMPSQLSTLLYLSLIPLQGSPKTGFTCTWKPEQGRNKAFTHFKLVTPCEPYIWVCILRRQHKASTHLPHFWDRRGVGTLKIPMGLRIGWPKK